MQAPPDAQPAVDAQRALLISCLLGGGILLLFFSVQARTDLPPELRSNTLWALVIGPFFFILGLMSFQNERVFTWWNDKLNKRAAWFGINTWQVVLLLMSPAFAVIATNAAGFWKRLYSPGVAITAWILGVTLAILGSLQWGKEKIHLSRNTLLWILFLTVFALLVRGIATARIPILLSGDEGSAGITAMDFVRGDWNNIFTTAWFAFPSFFSFIQSLSIRILGPSVEALRIPSAIAGALTVAATYLCGRKMFSERAGIFAALFLSALHFHVHFSRLGLNNIWDGLWYVITMGALCYGWQHEQRNAYLIAGFSLGFSQYFYTSSHALFAIILVGILLAAIFAPDRLKGAWPNIILMMLVTVAIALPLALFYLSDPRQFFAPFQRVSIFRGWLDGQIIATGQPAWKILLQQIGTGLQAYTYTPIIFWYKPETPILRPIGVALFYLGLIFLFLQDRNSRLVLLALWLLAFGFMGGLSDSTPAAQRYVAAAPACTLIVGYGLDKITQVGEQLWPKRAKIFTVVAYLVMIFAMASDLIFYFYEYTLKSEIDNIASNGMIAQQLATYLKDRPDGTQVAFFNSPGMGYYSIPSIQYLAPQVKGTDVTASWNQFDHSSFDSQNIIFVFLPSREDEIDVVRMEYPGGVLTTQKAWNNQTLYWLYDYGAP